MRFRRQRKKVIKSGYELGSNEEIVEHGPPGWPTNTPVIEETVVVKEKVPVFDKDGDRVWKRHPVTGVPVTAMNRLESKTVKRRYVPVELGNGNTIKNYDYLINPEDLKRQKRREAVQRVTEGLAERIVDEGLDVDDVIDRLVGRDSGSKSAKPEPPPKPQIGPEKVKVASGRYEVQFGGEDVVGRQLDSDEADEIIAEFNRRQQD